MEPWREGASPSFRTVSEVIKQRHTIRFCPQANLARVANRIVLGGEEFLPIEDDGEAVAGAVSTVDMALRELAEKAVVKLDDERKASMVSNLLVVLCGDSEAKPVINTGTLYQ